MLFRSAILATQQQRLDDNGERLRRALATRLAQARGDLAHASSVLRPSLLVARIAQSRERVDQLWRVAASLNPDLVLRRGYARIERAGGALVTNIGDARSAGRVDLVFADGRVGAHIDGSRVERTPRRPYSGQDGSGTSGSQGSLL